MKALSHLGYGALALILFCTNSAKSHAADPSLHKTEQDAVVIGFDTGDWKGADLSTEQVKVGTHSALWIDHLANESVTSSKIPHDWTGYDGLRLWIFNAGQSPVSFMLVLVSQKDRSTFSYYSHRVTVDWDGWKEVSIPFTAFEPNRDPAGWNKIDSVLFTSKGWALKPSAEASLYLDALTLTKAAP